MNCNRRPGNESRVEAEAGDHMRELSCQEFVELITSFLDGALDTELEHRFIKHLSTCLGCESYLDQIQRTIGALGVMNPVGVPDTVRDSLLVAFREHAVECRWADADEEDSHNSQ
jgi:anti-sigma factor RsiW